MLCLYHLGLKSSLGIVFIQKQQRGKLFAVFFCYFQAFMFPRGNIGGGNKITNSKSPVYMVRYVK